MSQAFTCSDFGLTNKKLMKMVFRVLLALIAEISWAPEATAQAAEAQGIQVLEQAVATAGGRQSWHTLKDYRAAGTLSLYSDGNVMESGNATILGSGLRRFRLTASLQTETRTWLWKDGVGVLST